MYSSYSYVIVAPERFLYLMFDWYVGICIMFPYLCSTVAKFLKFMIFVPFFISVSYDTFSYLKFKARKFQMH